METFKHLNLKLYTNEGCHLCEQAEDILEYVGASFQPIAIAGDLDLLRRYGVRIPVIVDCNGREIGWPFDSFALREWLDSAG